MDKDEHDWIFDYVLQFLESDKFDAALMDFIDEKCFIFDSDEENKFIYSDIHIEFREHIEALITSNLGEVGITPELFYESCQKSRNNRDINKAVFERIIAMEDFMTFKKIMVKRNVELQLEALQAFEWDTDNSESASLDAVLKASMAADIQGSPLRSSDERKVEADCDFSELSEEQIQNILRQSLHEMELLHRQEELEQAELEQAVALSLSIEQERVRLHNVDAKNSSIGPKEIDEREFKTSLRVSEPSCSKSNDDDKCEEETKSPSRSSHRPIGGLDNISDPKPLRSPGFGGGFKSVLPPIGGGGASVTENFEIKRREAEETLRRSQAQLTEQRRQEDAIRSQLNQIDPDEAARRAQHMTEQRDRLLAMKKAERERRLKEGADELDTTAVPDGVRQLQKEANLEAKRSPQEEEAERRRSTMRLALARRMKMELIESEEAKLAQMQDEQFSELDKKLRQVEQLRSDNKRREDLLADQLRKKQAAIARNVQKSAAALRESDNL